VWHLTLNNLLNIFTLQRWLFNRNPAELLHQSPTRSARFYRSNAAMTSWQSMHFPNWAPASDPAQSLPQQMPWDRLRKWVLAANVVNVHYWAIIWGMSQTPFLVDGIMQECYQAVFSVSTTGTRAIDKASISGWPAFGHDAGVIYNPGINWDQITLWIYKMILDCYANRLQISSDHNQLWNMIKAYLLDPSGN